MTKASDNVFPRLLVSEGGSTATPASGRVTMYAKANGLLYSKDDAGAETALGGGSSDLDAIITASSGQDIADALSGAAAPDSGNVFATMADVGGGGGSISTVDQDLGSDQVTNSTSTWTDLTGLTGISLTAGTWIAFCDIEVTTPVSYGPVFRITDGTTSYAQMGSLISNPVANVSNHMNFASKPFVLGGSATMKVQYNTDTVCTIKQYPTRGSDSSIPATHITFMKIA